MSRSALIRAGLPVLAVALGLIVLALGLHLAGFDAGRALAALWRGAFGSWYAITSATLVRAVPLMVIGLGLAIAFRAGVLNIGAEGQFYAGAVAAAWIGARLTGWPAPAAIASTWLLGCVAGAAWATPAAWLRRRFGVTEVISTLLLNFVAEGLVSLMVQGPLQESQRIYPQSEPIAVAARLPALAGTRLHLGLLLGVAIGGILAWVFRSTIWGFRLKAVGLGPAAARVSGRLDVGRVGAVALLASGALAGLAGSLEVGGVSYALYQNLSPGYGFTAIAVALLARLDPIGVVIAGVLFGALEAGAGAMQRDADVPAVAVYIVEAVVIVLVLLADALARRGVRHHPVLT